MTTVQKLGKMQLFTVFITFILENYFPLYLDVI